MKKYIIILLAFFSVSSAHAGIFEYYLGEQTTSNADNSSSADVIEQINVNITPAQDSYYHTSPRSTTSSYVSDTIRERYPYNTYDTDSYVSNGYYVYTELEKMLEDESYKLDRELDYIEDEKDDIKDTLRDIRNYNTRYYRELSKDLDNELQYLQKQEEYLEDIQEKLKDHLSDLRKNKNYNSKSHYYYNGNSIHRSSYYTYDEKNYYRNHSHDYDYYYDKRRYRVPHWVNQDLKEVQDGRIYIK